MARSRVVSLAKDHMLVASRPVEVGPPVDICPTVDIYPRVDLCRASWIVPENHVHYAKYFIEAHQRLQSILENIPCRYQNRIAGMLRPLLGSGLLL